VVSAAEAVIVAGGSWGTMNEIGLAMTPGRPVFQVGGWKVAPTSDAAVPYQLADASAAVRAALPAVRKRRNAREP
jgi:predicted Rossmann-fold nucleotide-binding protein